MDRAIAMLSGAEEKGWILQPRAANTHSVDASSVPANGTQPMAILGGKEKLRTVMEDDVPWELDYRFD